jgi:predicted nucleic acid-binding Zn ribbon protein
MNQLRAEALSTEEMERQKKLRRKNKILALAIGAFALAMVILSYLMFSKYTFIPYD